LGYRIKPLVQQGLFLKFKTRDVVGHKNQMKNLPQNIEQYFFDTIFGKVTLQEFEDWVYASKELESLLDADDYLELISFNFKKNGAKYELVNLLSDKYLDLGEYEKWKLLNSLKLALKRDDQLGSILRGFYDLYCRGYEFLNDLGLGYGLNVEVPPSPNYKVDTWEELSDSEKKELIASFYPQLELDIKRTIEWIENGKLIFTGRKDEIGHYEYKDLRTDIEKESTVWTEVENNEKTGFTAFKSNLKFLNKKKK
jgi:hypothetical protein